MTRHLASVVDREDPFDAILHMQEVESELRERHEPEASGPDLLDEDRDLRGVARAVDPTRLGDQDGRTPRDALVRGDVGHVLRLVVGGEEPIVDRPSVGFVDDLPMSVTEGSNGGHVDDACHSCLPGGV